MISRVLFAGLLAGMIAGVFISAVQMVKVVPLIVAAEAYEGGGHGGAPNGAHDHGPHGHGADAPQSAAGGMPWAPDDGWERTLFTTLSNVIIGIGYALLVAAAMTLRGHVAGWREGLVWGLGGFLSFALLPGLGLPPELPGMMAGDLEGRQVWWLSTAAASAAGLALIAFTGSWSWRVLGAVLLILPHIIGAPHGGYGGSDVPAEMAAEFVTASLVASALFWLVLGAVCGTTVGRALSPNARSAPKAA